MRPIGLYVSLLNPKNAINITPQIGNKNKDFKSFPISDNFEIKTTTEVPLLGMQIDSKSNFDKHVEFICQKAPR